MEEVIANLQREMQVAVQELRSMLTDVATRVGHMEANRPVDVSSSPQGPPHDEMAQSGRRAGEQNRQTTSQTPASPSERRCDDVPVPDAGVDLTKWAHKEKILLQGIEEMKKPNEWTRFLQQLRMGSDTYYPFVHEFAHAMKKLDKQPNGQDVRDMALTLGLDNEEMNHFLTDLWKVFVAKVRGPGCSILTHTLDTNSFGAQIALRSPIAWWELEREAEGATWSRKLDLARMCTNPVRARQARPRRTDCRTPELFAANS